MLELIAHRGMPRLARENTLVSFDLALKHGADAIELDVHVSADAIVVVNHDAELPDATPISSLSASELARYGVPRLDEVCELVGDRATLYVEAKARRSASPIVECLTGQTVRAAVHSFDYQVVDAVRALAPGLPVGLLVASRDADAVALARKHAARDVWPAVELIDAHLVDAIHALGTRVIAWTANDVNDARRLHELGVDGLCTDDVRAMRAALAI